MAERVFVDTNVLVYRFDRRDQHKRDVSTELIETLVAADSAVISSQVLSEFTRVFAEKLDHIAPRPLGSAVASIAGALRVVPVTPATILAALSGMVRHHFAFYDAQIWAAAVLAGASVVVSEDFSEGRIAEGVRFVNPFADGFDARAFLREVG